MSGRPSAERPQDGAPGALLGVDLGSRRIGLALGDARTGHVVALRTLRRSSTARDAASLAAVCREHGVAELVVGLPLHMGGSEGGQAREARAWAQEMGALLRLPVSLRDERLTSQAAESRMARPPRGRSGGPPSAASLRAWRARVDREAAAVILQSELDARRGVGGAA